ncbi:MAG: hypothetical protein ACLVJR_08585, partial [Negativibacillus sp.]
GSDAQTDCVQQQKKQQENQHPTNHTVMAIPPVVSQMAQLAFLPSSLSFYPMQVVCGCSLFFPCLFCRTSKTSPESGKTVFRGCFLIDFPLTVF